MIYVRACSVLLGVMVFFSLPRFSNGYSPKTVEPEKEDCVTRFYPNTAISKQKGLDGTWEYGEMDGHATLVLAHLKPFKSNPSSSWWYEILSLEFSNTPSAGKIDLTKTKIKMGYASSRGRHGWGIGKEGASGFLTIEDVKPGGIMARYDILVSVVDLQAQFRDSILFQGRTTFENKARPVYIHDPDFPVRSLETIAALGKLFPE